MARSSAAVVVFVFSVSVLTAADSPKTANEHWQIQGELTEACTCNVPCTCNFGQGPSPRHYCWALFSLNIQKGHYGNVTLDGLRLAGLHGKKSDVWYLDDRAAPGQAAALKKIATDMSKRRKLPVRIETARIVQEVGEKSNRLEISDAGGFEADYLMGRDGKTPIILENNTSWNIPRSIKAKTKTFRYKDAYGNKIDMKKTNSNQGKFDWNDQTNL